MREVFITSLSVKNQICQPLRAIVFSSDRQKTDTHIHTHTERQKVSFINLHTCQIIVLQYNIMHYIYDIISIKD